MSTTEATQQNVSSRIVGTYIQQEWVRDNAEEVKRVEFDATLHVLNIPYERLISVRDLDDTSEAIGNAHVEWDGPHSVLIVDSICGFFGVDRLATLTPAMLDAAYRARGMNALAALEPKDIVRAWYVKRWEEKDLAQWTFEEVNTRIAALRDEEEEEDDALLDHHSQEVQASEEYAQAKRYTRDEAENRSYFTPTVTGDLIDAIADVRYGEVVTLLRSKGYDGELRMDVPSTIMVIRNGLVVGHLDPVIHGFDG